jgi:hypothetical protein
VIMMPSQMDNVAFRYQPLVEADSFRLLLIQPSIPDATQVECRLLNTTLSNCDRDIIDHYTALSYVWGDPSQTRRILLDGHEVIITATLEAALRDLRDDTRVVRLWADALCIDQSNIDERNQQVQQMGKIYATAHHTVIYLGPLTTSADAVLHAVPRKNSLETESKVRVVDTAESDLLKRPWFRRVWVFQELVLSRDPWVQCGSLRVRWTELCGLLLPSMGSVSNGLKLLKDMQDARAGRVGTSLFNLLLSRRGLGATDPRDMVYAQLGLASDLTESSQYLNIDYQRSVSRVYEDVARYLLDKVGPELLFFHIDDVDRSDRCKDLASWAPDWRLLPSYSGPMFKDNKMKTLFLKAKAYYIFTVDPSMVAYLGYDIEIVSNVSIALPQSSQMNAAGRESYQGAVKDILNLYASQGGAYGVGDANGQYSRISLRGKMEEHKRLCDKICEEWLHILSEELPSSMPSKHEEELESHKRFLDMFRTWITGRAEEEILFLGSDSDGLLAHLYYHLLQKPIRSVLDGRRLAGMESGRVGVVPSHARDGDLVVYLAGSPISILLRKVAYIDTSNLRETIIEAFLAKDNEPTPMESRYLESFKDLFETKDVPIVHAKIIGECYVDGVVGWLHNQAFDHKIFALH